jgi:hypothetical protein
MDIYNFAFLLPAMKAVMRDFAAQDPQLAKTPMGPMMENLVILGPVISALYVAYPIIVLIIMLLPSVRSAFRGAPSVSHAAGEYEEEQYEEPWGRRGRDEPDDRIQPDER